MSINPQDQPWQPKSFTFSKESLAFAEKIIKRYPEGRQHSAVIPLLDIVQRQEGWVSMAAMNVVGEMLDMAPMRVYEVATFYTMFHLKPVGKVHVQVCTNLPCQLRGSDSVVATCKHELGIGLGETTADGKFSLAEVECLGACVNAPAIWIGDDYYEDLDADSTKKMIEAFKRGETPKAGPQNGRQTSAPIGGPTTLISKEA
jgi:NADH-quinone oxidoreductase subunit E/NADH dehydrogenase (ubiquinone) flavoprotein 2